MAGDARGCRRRLESFPLTEFPNVVALAETVTTLPAEVQFEFGLDVLVERLEAWCGAADR